VVRRGFVEAPAFERMKSRQEIGSLVELWERSVPMVVDHEHEYG
jgi:hypothetical protein